jgi:hypothetical protein
MKPPERLVGLLQQLQRETIDVALLGVKEGFDPAVE